MKFPEHTDVSRQLHMVGLFLTESCLLNAWSSPSIQFSTVMWKKKKICHCISSKCFILLEEGWGKRIYLSLFCHIQAQAKLKKAHWWVSTTFLLCCCYCMTQCSAPVWASLVFNLLTSRNCSDWLLLDISVFHMWNATDKGKAKIRTHQKIRKEN